MQGIPVWDPLVRLLHWGLMLCVVIAWLSTLDIGVPAAWHEPSGYGAMGITAVRVVWGVIGSRHARFISFVRSPRETWRYARIFLIGKAPRHLGHNPLGAWMSLALMALVIALTFVGWLQTTDDYWGSETLDNIHNALAWALLAMIAAHVCGVFITSRSQNECLVQGMIHGRKRPPAGHDKP